MQPYKSIHQYYYSVSTCGLSLDSEKKLNIDLFISIKHYWNLKSPSSDIPQKSSSHLYYIMNWTHTHRPNQRIFANVAKDTRRNYIRAAPVKRYFIFILFLYYWNSTIDYNILTQFKCKKIRENNQSISDSYRNACNPNWCVLAQVDSAINIKYSAHKCKRLEVASLLLCLQIAIHFHFSLLFC